MIFKHSTSYFKTCKFHYRFFEIDSLNTSFRSCKVVILSSLLSGSRSDFFLSSRTIRDRKFIQPELGVVTPTSRKPPPTTTPEPTTTTSWSTIPSPKWRKKNPAESGGIRSGRKFEPRWSLKLLLTLG